MVFQFYSQLNHYKAILGSLKPKNTDFKRLWNNNDKYLHAFNQLRVHIKRNQNQLLFHPVPHLKYGIDIGTS